VLSPQYTGLRKRHGDIVGTLLLTLLYAPWSVEVPGMELRVRPYLTCTFTFNLYRVLCRSYLFLCSPDGQAVSAALPSVRPC
jgi:hypothetical protein